MNFTIRPDEPVAAAVRRVIDEQLGSAIDRLHGADAGDSAEAVHEARKSCKRLRAVFRMVRPALPAARYRTLNATVRDAAGELSGTRDAQALVAMFDDLVTVHGERADDDELAVVRRALADRADLVGEDDDSGRALVRAAERLELARDAAARLNLKGCRFDTLAKGMAATYGDGRRALHHLRREHSPERSHEWRKSVKYTWHHVELIEPAAPLLLGPTGRGLHDVSDALGDAHNLAVLVDLLRQAPARFGGPDTAERVVRMATDAQGDLEDRAIRLGLRLYAEKPKAFARRMTAYWRAAEAGAELPTGELADVAAPRKADGAPGGG